MGAQSRLDQAPLGWQPPEAVAKAVRRKQGGRNRRPEDEIQRALCQYLSLHKNILYFSVPNHFYLGGSDHGKRAAYIQRQKALGLLNGVSDLVICFRNKHGSPITVFCEVKADANTLSDAQQIFHERANMAGAYTGVVRSIDELQALLALAGYP